MMPEPIRTGKINYYINAETAKQMNDKAGRTLLRPQLDIDGNRYRETLVVPEAATDFVRFCVEFTLAEIADLDEL